MANKTPEPPTMDNEHVIPEEWRRIAYADYEALFAHGGCFVFAMRLHEKHTYKIRGFRLVEKGSWNHVWAVKDERCGVDIRGVYPEEILARLANKGEATPAIEDVSVEEVRAAIEKKNYPENLLSEMNRLADFLLDRHERLREARPPNQNEFAVIGAKL